MDFILMFFIFFNFIANFALSVFGGFYQSRVFTRLNTQDSLGA